MSTVYFALHFASLSPGVSRLERTHPALFLGGRFVGSRLYQTAQRNSGPPPEWAHYFRRVLRLHRNHPESKSPYWYLEWKRTLIGRYSPLGASQGAENPKLPLGWRVYNFAPSARQERRLPDQYIQIFYRRSSVKRNIPRCRYASKGTLRKAKAASKGT